MTDREWAWFVAGAGQAFIVGALVLFAHGAGGHAFGFASVGVTQLASAVFLYRKARPRYAPPRLVGP